MYLITSSRISSEMPIPTIEKSSPVIEKMKSVCGSGTNANGLGVVDAVPEAAWTST
jgi:hypothetical protein